VNINVTTSGGSSQVAVGGSNVTQIQSSSDDGHLKEYIRFLYENQVEDIENSTVWEMAEQFFGYDPEDEELKHVFELLRTAQVEVTVTW